MIEIPAQIHPAIAQAIPLVAVGAVAAWFIGKAWAAISRLDERLTQHEDACEKHWQKNEERWQRNDERWQRNEEQLKQIAEDIGFIKGKISGGEQS